MLVLPYVNCCTVFYAVPALMYVCMLLFVYSCACIAVRLLLYLCCCCGCTAVCVPLRVHCCTRTAASVLLCVYLFPCTVGLLSAYWYMFFKYRVHCLYASSAPFPQVAKTMRIGPAKVKRVFKLWKNIRELYHTTGVGQGADRGEADWRPAFTPVQKAQLYDFINKEHEAGPQVLD